MPAPKNRAKVIKPRANRSERVKRCMRSPKQRDRQRFPAGMVGKRQAQQWPGRRDTPLVKALNARADILKQAVEDQANRMAAGRQSN